MKSISNALSNHLDQEVTTLATCWKIVRTDGFELGFTSHDTDLEIDGLVYDSAHGYSSSAISANSDFSVDNSDVNGVLDSDKITDADLKNGLYNFAEVYMFVINWSDLSQGILKLRRGWFGEVTVGQNGQFTTELRGMNQALSHSYVEVFTPECRTDFCSAKCKLNIKDFEQSAVVYSAAAGARRTFTTSGVEDVVGSTSVGAYKKWRILVHAAGGDNVYAFSDIQFFDQTGAEITGGTPSALHWTKKHEPKKGRDSDYHSEHWSSDFVPETGSDEEAPIWPDAWFQMSWDSVKDVKAISITVGENFHRGPTSFALQFSNNDGLSWSTALSCSIDQWTKDGQTAVWGIGSGSVDPINYPDAPISVAPPFTGASTFVGGTVRWTAGMNRGRTMEIIDFSGQTITLFEGMAYEINAGDTFVIAQGCDKQAATCKLYDNIINFRGEPFVPGQDEFMRYPDAAG